MKDHSVTVIHIALIGLLLLLAYGIVRTLTYGAVGTSVRMVGLG